MVAFILCLVVALASGVSKSLTNPVNQLVDLVKALNSLDFSNHVRLCCCVVGSGAVHSAKVEAS